jgi:hypothetical protein
MEMTTTCIYQLPDEVLVSIFLFLCDDNMSDISSSYVSRSFRLNYLRAVSLILNLKLSISLSPVTHSRDLVMYAMLSAKKFTRKNFRDFTAYSETRIRTIFGSRNVTHITMDEFMKLNYKEASTFSLTTFLEKRLNRISQIRKNDICRSYSRSVRQTFVDDLCLQFKFPVIPYDLSALIRAFILSNQSTSDNIRTRFVAYKRQSDSGLVPENFFKFKPTSIGPSAICYNLGFQNHWLFSTRYVLNNRTIGTWIESFSQETGFFNSLFKLPQIESRNLKGFKVNDVGDFIFLYKTDPWLKCYTPSGTFIWSLKRQYFNMFAKPKQLLVGKSGVIYISDPIACHVHRITPSGIPITPIHWNITSLDLICLTAGENIAISSRTESPTVFVLDWCGSILKVITLLNSSPSQIISSTGGNWIVQDELTRSIKVYPDSGGSFIQEIPAWNRKLELLHSLPKNRLAVFIEHRSNVEIFKISNTVPVND